MSEMTPSPIPTAQSNSSPEDKSPSHSEPAPSYVKLAMRNMVKKGRQSLVHFGLTAFGLIALLVGLAYLTR